LFIKGSRIRESSVLSLTKTFVLSLASQIINSKRPLGYYSVVRGIVRSTFCKQIYPTYVNRQLGRFTIRSVLYFRNSNVSVTGFSRMSGLVPTDSDNDLRILPYIYIYPKRSRQRANRRATEHKRTNPEILDDNNETVVRYSCLCTASRSAGPFNNGLGFEKC